MDTIGHCTPSLSTATRRLIARVPGALTILDVAPDGKSALVSTGAGWYGIVAANRGETHEQNLDLYGRTRVMGLSADGKWLLALEDREVGQGTYLLSTDGQQTIRLGDDPGIGLSPDGQWVLTIPKSSPSRLVLMPTSAGTARDVPIPPQLEPGDAPPARWSADGRRLFAVFTERGRGARSARFYMREEDQPWQPVTPEGIAGPYAVSPDGLFIAAGDGTGTVTLYPTGGGAPRQLAGERGLPFSWSADGRWLFLRSSLHDMPLILYRRELVSGRVERWWNVAPADLSGIVGPVGMPWISNDGNFIVYGYARALNDLYLAQGLR
ncbi:MAG: TolB family protein [Vicinamibacterales bacterium]